MRFAISIEEISGGVDCPEPLDSTRGLKRRRNGLSNGPTLPPLSAGTYSMKTSIAPFVFVCLLPLCAVAAPTATHPFCRVDVDGRELPLHEFRQGAFGVFELARPAEITVHTAFDARWVDIRPKSAALTAVVEPDHHTIRFRLASVVPLTVEFNRDLEHVLHLFAYAPEVGAPVSGTPGVRWFGPGEHDAGLIDLHDGETLYLAPGAWVRGHVRSIGTHDVAVRGRGVLDGSVGGLAGDPAVVGPGTDGEHNMIYLERTERARIEGITIFNSPGAWTVYLNRSNGARIDGVRILNPSVHYGDDGFDLVSSSDVLLENSFVRTNDDCVVVKNLADVDTHDITVRHAVLWNMPTGGNGLEIGFETRQQPIHRVRFEDIDIIHVERGSAISIHNGDADTVEDVVFDNIRVEDARRKLIDFAVVYAQYGADRPATDAENARRLDTGGLWDGLLGYPPAEQKARAGFRGRIRNVLVKDLHVVDGALPYSIFAGFDADHPVADVVVEGLQHLGRPIRSPEEGKFVIENAPGFVLRPQ